MKAVSIILSTLCALSVTPLFVNAAAQVNYLNIDGDAVHFSIAEAKTETSPSCVATETSERFAFSLKTDAGRAMYSLLITAMAAKQDIAVESAQDCADVAGIERTDGISIAPAVVPSNTAGDGGKQFYLYKSDGVTKLGIIITTDGSNAKAHYLDLNDPNPSTFSMITLASKANVLYFSAENCQGVIYSSMYYTQFFTHPHYNNNKLMQTKNGNAVRSILSNLDANGQCNNVTESAYRFEVTDFSAIHPVCGDEACLIKYE